MAKNQDEIEDDDLDTEDNIDDEDTEDEEDEDAEGDDDSDGEDDDEESDDDDSSEDDDEASLPKNRKELNKTITAAVAEELKRRGKNRSAADRRTSKTGKPTNRERSRSGKNDERLDSIEQRQARIDRLEQKRQFGYDTGLAPDEVNVVFKLRKNPSKKSLTDPIIQGALDGYRKHKRATGNIPGNGGGNRPTKASAKEEKNMTQGERNSRLADRRQEILSGKR